MENTTVYYQIKVGTDRRTFLAMMREFSTLEKAEKYASTLSGDWYIEKVTAVAVKVKSKEEYQNGT